MTSYVYVMESGHGYCKVGKSDNPESRIRAIEVEMGISITRIEKFKCTGDPMATERKTHEILKQSSIFREWFSIDFEKACEIASAQSKVNHSKNEVSGYHKQASLHKATHKLIDEIAEVMQDKPDVIGKVSKADVVHSAVLAMHKKVVKK